MMHEVSRSGSVVGGGCSVTVEIGGKGLGGGRESAGCGGCSIGGTVGPGMGLGGRKESAGCGAHGCPILVRVGPGMGVGGRRVSAGCGGCSVGVIFGPGMGLGGCRESAGCGG